MISTNLILFDDSNWGNLLPLTYTRPISELRIGITTIREKWQNYASKISWKTQDYLSEKYPLSIEHDNIFVLGNVLPNAQLVDIIAKLEKEQSIVKDNRLIAFRSGSFSPDNMRSQINFDNEINSVEHTWDIFAKNDQILRLDFDTITKGRKSQAISPTNNTFTPENIFIEEGAVVEYSTIDATTGPVYIGRNAEIMAGTLIKGPLAVCDRAIVKMGTKIYGATTIGPGSKVGGEIQNSVLYAYSNKGHNGYLGHAVLGEWCNIGAGTNNSNLKNNYTNIKAWNYPSDRFIDTGLQFCGLIMADHAKCGINTLFNTGTVIGVYANVFGSGFLRNFVPSFSWGGTSGFSLYTLTKALETAELVMARRKVQLTEVDKKILGHVFTNTKKYRKLKNWHGN